MQDALLPLFPLQLVLLPGVPLPLHIFENRYKEMMSELIGTHAEFGIVQASENGIVNVGCSATVEQVLKQYPDGRIDLMTLGRRRFEIFLLNDEKSFLRGAVHFFDDDEEAQASLDLQERALASFNELRSLEQAEVIGDPQVHDPRLSFKLTQLIPELNFRQTMLALRSETERLKRLTEFLPEYIEQKRRAAQIRTIAPRNGHFHLPGSLS